MNEVFGTGWIRILMEQQLFTCQMAMLNLQKNQQAQEAQQEQARLDARNAKEKYDFLVNQRSKYAKL